MRTVEEERRGVLSSGKAAVDSMRALDRLLERDPGLSGTRGAASLLCSLEQGSANVVLFGNYSSGKSTLLTSLVGESELLPVHQSPTTAVLTELRRSSNRRARLDFARHRIIGDFQGRRPEEEHPTLTTVLELTRDRGVRFERVEQSRTGTGGWTKLSPLDIADRVRELEEHREARQLPGPPPFRWIRLTFQERGSEPIELGERGRDSLDGWVGGTPRSLALDQVNIELPTEHLDRVVLVDTPGIDSLVREHRQVTKAAVEGSHAAIFHFNASNYNVAERDRVALRQLFDWMVAPPEALFIAATFADLVLENVLDEEEELQEASAAEAIEWLRRQIAGGVTDALRSARKAGFRGAIEPSKVFMINGLDFESAEFHGGELRRGLRAFLEETEGAPLLRSTCIRLGPIFERSEATIRTVLRDAGTSGEDPASLKARARKAGHVVELISGKLLSTLLAESGREIAATVSRIRGWVAQGVQSKSDVTSFAHRWDQQLKKLDDALATKLVRRLKSVEDDVNELLESGEARFVLPELDRSRLRVRSQEVARPVQGLGWFLKGIPDFFLSTSLRRSNIKQARARISSEIDRLERALKAMNKKRVEAAMQEASKYVTVVQKTLDAAQKHLERLAKDERERKAFLQQLEAAANTLRTTRRALEGVGRGS